MARNNHLDRLRRDCAEAYQIVGVLAEMAGVFRTKDVQRALDNLSGLPVDIDEAFDALAIEPLIAGETTAWSRDRILPDRLRNPGANQLRDSLAGKARQSRDFSVGMSHGTCHTANVDALYLPSEIVGLPAAFFRAGARAVIASLWDALDVASALIMYRFYMHMLGDGLGPPAALRMGVVWFKNLSLGELDALIDVLEKTSSGNQRREREALLTGGAFLIENRLTTLPVIWAAFACYGT